MNDVERILRAQELESKYKRFYNLMKKKRWELDKHQENCKHEIVVFTEYSHCYAGYDDDFYQKCLFCGDESTNRQSFYGSSCIDVSCPKSMEYLNRKEKFEIVKRLYIKTAMENTNLSSEQIQKLVEGEIEKPTDVFWKITNDVVFSHS